MTARRGLLQGLQGCHIRSDPPRCAASGLNPAAGGGTCRRLPDLYLEAGPDSAKLRTGELLFLVVVVVVVVVLVLPVTIAADRLAATARASFDIAT
jgi:hypothetical protein